jgi:nicotinamidase-related amidase
MKKFFNKTIYDSIDEIVSPEHTVLVVWDVQNALVNSIFNKQDFLNNLKSLINRARQKRVPIIYSKITPLPAQYNSSWAIYSNMKRYGVDDPEKLPPFMKPGTIDAEIASDVAPSSEDVIINKHTASLFVGTHVEYLLRNKGIETVVFTGISTEFGIASSARDASNRGFYPVVVRNCVSSRSQEMHELSLKVLTQMVIVTSSDEIKNAWK